MAGWRRDGEGCGDVLEQLLPDARTSVFGQFELGHPVVDRRVEFGEGLFLFEDRVVGEARDAGRAKIGADALVKIAPAGAERLVGIAQIIAAFVESTKFLEIVSTNP